ncbi:hypothetical protein NFI96_004441, partial [Prochilodus magdalenae]
MSEEKGVRGGLQRREREERRVAGHVEYSWGMGFGNGLKRKRLTLFSSGVLVCAAGWRAVGGENHTTSEGNVLLLIDFIFTSKAALYLMCGSESFSPPSVTYPGGKLNSLNTQSVTFLAEGTGRESRHIGADILQFAKMNHSYGKKYTTGRTSASYRAYGNVLGKKTLFSRSGYREAARLKPKQSYRRQLAQDVLTYSRGQRFLRTQSLEWYYNNVKTRFKRFGSAKVLKTLYRKHIIERGALCELPVCVCCHSMAETLTVALRVAEEAIEEAIAKADSYRDSLEKQNEARYLRDHKEELIEELASTIVQKVRLALYIIQRGKRPEMQVEYDLVWSQAQNSELPSSTSAPNAHPAPQHTPHQPSQSSLRSSYTLWRSRSAFSLTSDESPDKAPEADADEPPPGCVAAEPEPDIQLYSSLRRESRASSVPGWKSVDRLDNSTKQMDYRSGPLHSTESAYYGASSVLQSPDGNWIALQSSQHSRPSLLTKRKSLVFSVLEKESGVVSAYDEMGSGSDSDAEDQSGWGVALLQFRRRLSDESYYTDSQHNPEWTYARPHPPITSPSSGQYTNTETLNSDSEASIAPPIRLRRPSHNIHQRKKGPTERHLPYMPYAPYRRPPDLTAPPPLRSDALDVNFNPRVGGDSSEGEERSSEQIRRSRRRRRSKRELAEQSHRAHGSLYSAATA